MIRIRNVGTNHGDCFFIEIANDINRSIVMVDGRKGDQKSLGEIEKTIEAYGRIDYLIVTHIDQDHINGILKIFERPKTNPVRQAFYHTIILYNYVTRPVISYTQACAFEKLIQENPVVSTVKRHYGKYSSPCLKMLSFEQRRNIDPSELYGSENYAVLTILHPQREGVESVYQDYLAHPKKATANLVNKNSIAFLLEYEKKTALFTGDCYLKDIADRIDQLSPGRGAGGHLRIDIIKIPHHGGRDNNEELAQFAKVHQTRQFILTAKEEVNQEHPVKDILMKLDAVADDTNRMVIHTHTDLSQFGELEHITIDTNDLIEWGKTNDQ